MAIVIFIEKSNVKLEFFIAQTCFPHSSLICSYVMKIETFFVSYYIKSDSLNSIFFNSSDVRRFKFSFAIKFLQFSRCFSTIFQEENLADRCRNLIFDLMISVSRIM